MFCSEKSFLAGKSWGVLEGAARPELGGRMSEGEKCLVDHGQDFIFSLSAKRTIWRLSSRGVLRLF